MAKTASRNVKDLNPPDEQDQPIPFSIEDDVTHVQSRGKEFDLYALSGTEPPTELGESLGEHVRHVKPIQKIVSLVLPDSTQVIHWHGMEFDLDGLHADGAGKPTTEYEDREVKLPNGKTETQVWKREPGGKWERCTPCEESRKR